MQRRYSLRCGYNFNSDIMRLSAGAGIAVPLKLAQGTIDYAYTDGGPLLGINRLSLGFRF